MLEYLEAHKVLNSPDFYEEAIGPAHIEKFQHLKALKAVKYSPGVEERLKGLK